MNAIHGKKIKSRMILALYIQIIIGQIYMPTIQNKRWRNKERIRKEMMNIEAG
jgi:hypothetical protein